MQRSAALPPGAGELMYEQRAKVRPAPDGTRRQLPKPLLSGFSEGDQEDTALHPLRVLMESGSILKSGQVLQRISGTVIHVRHRSESLG